MATLSDIAAIVGVNKTTVSKALRGSNDISRETQQKVLAAAAQLDYHVARRKAVGQSKLVGVLCPEVVSYYYSRLVTALNAHLLEQGYTTVMLLTDFSHKREEASLHQLALLNVAGVVCITEQPNIGDIIASAMQGLNAPVVIMGLNYEATDHDVISVDERTGIRCAVEKLVELKHCRIAFIGDELVDSRLRYVKEALAQKGIDLPQPYISLGAERNGARGYSGMRQLLALDAPPTAVIAGYDTIALGAYRALSEYGLSVPGDVSLVGFDDADFCQHLPVSLTSINSNVADMCSIVIAILLKKIRNPDYQIIQTVAIQPGLIIRESTGIARQ